MKKRKIDPLEEIMSNPYYQLRDEYNDAEKIKWTMSFAQYSMTYWAAERDIVLNGTKKEITTTEKGKYGYDDANYKLTVTANTIQATASAIKTWGSNPVVDYIVANYATIAEK